MSSVHVSSCYSFPILFKIEFSWQFFENSQISNVVWTFGEDCINRNGPTLREFASFNDLKITKTFFRKKEIHKYTWSARGSKSTIDYIIVNRRINNLVQDIKIFRGTDIGSDHFLVTSRIKLLNRWKQQSNNSKLANEQMCWLSVGRLANSQLKSTTRTNYCIYTVYLLMMGYKYARNM
jgi:hypothetical protein